MKTLCTSLFIFSTLILFGQQTNETMTVGNENRTYIQYLPTGFDPATESLPVVFCLHGLGGTAAGLTPMGFNLIADTARFIIIYPQGLPNNFGQNGWVNGTLLSPVANDEGFFNQMIDEMILNKNADPSRIYSTGFSMGSIMSHHLACALNDRIAAIATMSGTISTDDLNNCVPNYATPVIHFHGTADAVVPYDGTPLASLELVAETMDFWRNVHGCASTADSTQLPNTGTDLLTVDRFVYQNCTPAESVELWRINGGGHDYFYAPLNDFTEAVEIWKFFMKWSHPNPGTVSTTEIEQKEYFQAYPNPINEHITISAPMTENFVIIDLHGKVVKRLNVAAGIQKHSLSLPSGIYTLSPESKPELSQRIVIQ